MKEYSMEMPKTPETAAQRLSAKAVEIIKAAEAAIAVEIYHEAHGMGEDATEEDKKQAEQEYFADYREKLLAILDGSTALPEVLSVYDAYAKNEKDAEATQQEIAQIILESDEHTKEVSDFESATTEEFTATGAELTDFVEKMIMDNIDNTSVKSKWGNAKLEYEKGDSARLLSTLQEELKRASSAEDEVELKKYIEFLEHQRFGA